MTTFFIIFWSTLIFASIAWYGFLVFYVGAKGGRDILTMIRHLEARAPESSDSGSLAPDPTTDGGGPDDPVSRP